MENEQTQYSLSKYLALCGAASRRHAVDMIRSGRVSVDGAEERNPAARVTGREKILCGGRLLTLPKTHHYIMLNKPRGYVCTSEDPHARKKALDLIRLPGNPRLFSAGRLDKDSEGMILFSDDGNFVHTLTHPGNGVRKTYEVSMDHPLSPADIRRMTEGIRSDADFLRALRIEPLTDRKYRFILGEGKNREIRRMAEAVGNEAVRLKRVAVGSLKMGSLPCGAWKNLSQKERALALRNTEAEDSSKNNGKPILRGGSA